MVAWAYTPQAVDSIGVETDSLRLKADGQISVTGNGSNANSAVMKKDSVVRLSSDSLAMTASADSVSDLMEIDMLSDSLLMANLEQAEEVDTPSVVLPPTPALLAAWSRCYPLGRPSPEARIAAMTDTTGHSALWNSLDSLVSNPAISYAQGDLRLPIVLNNQVPDKGSNSLEQTSDKDAGELPDYVPEMSNIFSQQLAYSAMRERAVHDYSMHHLNRVAMLRPDHYDLPTERKLIQRQELTGNEMVDTGLPLELEPSGLNIEQVTFHADKWHRRGTTDLQISQTSLTDNWYKGGENNLTISTYDKLAFSRYDESMKTTLEITLELRLSGYYTKADTIHPMRVNDNQFRADVSYGYKAYGNWYYSTSAYLKTPIFEYFNANSRTVKSTFFSPLEFNVAVGMDLKQSKKKNYSYSFMFAPMSYNMKSVSDHRVSVTSYGIEEDKHSLHQFGASITGKLEWKMSDVVTWVSRAYFFTSYHNTQLEFENTFNLTLGRYSTAKVYLFPRFDDSVDDSMQMKEMLTFGLAFVW